MAYVGGVPDRISSGGMKFRTTAKAVQGRVAGINGAQTYQCDCGDAVPSVGDALSRFVAVAAAYTGGVSTELDALATAATNGADDLDRVGGGK